MRDFDYFRKQKETGLTSAYETIQFVTESFSEFIGNDANQTNIDALRIFFLKMLKVHINTYPYKASNIEVQRFFSLAFGETDAISLSR